MSNKKIENILSNYESDNKTTIENISNLLKIFVM